MPKTKSHLTIGAWNNSLSGRTFRHTTAESGKPGKVYKSPRGVQYAPDENRPGMDRFGVYRDMKARPGSKYDEDLDPQGGGIPMSGSAGTDTIIGGAGKDTLGRRQRTTERKIREAAVKRGIDPNVAVRVAKSEGLLSKSWQSKVVDKKGRREKSYGPFQLNIEKGRLGAQFMKDTGLDPRNPETVDAQIDYALDHAAKNGWGAWFGAANVGIGRRQGLQNARAIGITEVAEAPAPAAPAGGLLASFFGTAANAAEAPQGLGAQQAEVDYFGSVPTTDWSQQREEAVRERAALQAPQGLGAMSPSERIGQAFTGSPSPSNYADVRVGSASTPQASPSIDPRAYASQTAPVQKPDMAAIEGARNGVMGLGAFTPAVQSALAASKQAPIGPEQQAGYFGGQIGAPKVDQNGGIMSSALAGLGDIGKALGPGGGVAVGTQYSPDGKVADPFGNYKPGGPLATVQKDFSAPFSTAAAAAEDQPGSIHVGGLQPLGPEATITGTPGISLDGSVQGLGSQYGVITGDATISPPEEYDQTIAPPDMNTSPDAPPDATRTRQAVNAVRSGLQQLQQGLSGGIDSGPAAMGGHSFGSGLAAMQAAMGGSPGDMAQSRSNPGYSFQKTATGGIRYGPKGWQALDEAGEQSGGLHKYDGEEGESRGLGGFFSGLFGGGLGRRDKDKSKDKDGKGGLGRYSGNGLY